MKQIIILFSTILLGIAIGGFVLSLEDSAKSITDSVKHEIAGMVENQEID